MSGRVAHPVPVLSCALIALLGLLTAALPSRALPPGPNPVHPVLANPEYVSLPYFDWDDLEGLAEPYPGSYEVQIDDTSDFALPLRASATIPALISYYSPHDEIPSRNARYYWRVRHLDAAGVADTEWSDASFYLHDPHVIYIALKQDPVEIWQAIKAAIQAAIVYRQTGSDFAEVQFASEYGNTIEVTQPACGTGPVVQEQCEIGPDEDSPSCNGDGLNDYLFFINGSSDHPTGGIIINGQNRKLLINASRRTCGVYRAQWASGLQIRKLTVDFAPDSLSQFGGEIIAIDPEEHKITVEVDSDVYQNEAEFAPVMCGFFVNSEKHQRIGSQGVSYNMGESWGDARVGSGNTYEFTTSGWGYYGVDPEDPEEPGELKVGDYFVSTARGGDSITLFKSVDDFVANDLTFKGNRGRYFIVRYDENNDEPPVQYFSHFNRSIRNKFLRTGGRILGGPTGGVNDKGISTWHEDVQIQSTRDDAFHTGIPEGSENVLLNSEITGAYRNSAWIQADRSWIEGNTISDAGTDGIALGGGEGENHEAGTDTQVRIGLIKNNTIISPRRSGIVSRPLLDETTDKDYYNRHITLVGNTVRDHQMDQAVLLDFLAESEVSGNTVESTGISIHPSGAWRLSSDPAHQKGFEITNSLDVSGSGNLVTDSRIPCSDRRYIDPASTSNVTLGLAFYESWGCAAVQSFTAPGTLAADYNWSINDPDFKVQVLDSTPLGSRAFGRIVSDVLSGKSATALDEHTVVLPETLAPGTKAIRLQARFVFNELTTLGRGEVRFGVANSSSGQLYGIGLATTTTIEPVVLYAASTNNSIALGIAGDQSTSGVWEVDATFRRVSSTVTTVAYTVERPGGAPYSGTANFSTAVGASTTFNQGFIAFKQRGQVVFDSIQVTAAD